MTPTSHRPTGAPLHLPFLRNGVSSISDSATSAPDDPSAVQAQKQAQRQQHPLDPQHSPQGVAARLGLIGDVHAEHGRLETAIRTLKDAGADTLLCTGDLCDGPGDLQRCIELIQAHDVICVRGNHDRWMLDERVRHLADAHFRAQLSDTVVNFLSTLPTQTSVSTTAGLLMLCHGILDNDMAKVWPGSERMPAEKSRGLDKLIARGSHRLLVNGHMHYRIVLDFPGLTHINAGTLSPRHRPGVTLLDCAANDLKIFEFGDHEKRLRHTGTEVLLSEERYVWPNTAAFDESAESRRQPLALYS